MVTSLIQLHGRSTLSRRKYRYWSMQLAQSRVLVLLFAMLFVNQLSLSMICPSCLMFDSHKGHPVCKIQQGAKDLRTRINGAAKDGLLKFEKTESILLDIRHAKLSLEENAETIIIASEKYFDDLISTVKTRKARFLDQLRQHFTNQIDFIDRAQQEWLQKQEVSQRILKLQSSKDDIKIMEQASDIIQGLEGLAQQPNYREVQLIEAVDSELQIGKHRYAFKEVTEALGQYLRKGRQIVNRIKC